MLNILNKKVKTEQQIEMDEIKKDLKECERLIARNDIIFNMAADEGLIDSKIYEREALLHHYDYLIRRLREKQKTSSAEKSDVVKAL